MKHTVWRVASVALVGMSACGTPAAPPVIASGAVAGPLGPFPADRVLQYRVTSSSGDGEDLDDGAADEGELDVACKQRTEAVDRWFVSTIECDPGAGMFAARARLEQTYVTDGRAWSIVPGRLTPSDDAARWAGRPLRGPELAQVRAYAADLVPGPPPWATAGTGDGCDRDVRATPADDDDDDHASSEDGVWCPLDGGGLRSGSTEWSSESGYHSGSTSVALVSITPLR